MSNKNDSGTITLTNCTITDNMASVGVNGGGRGGGVYNKGGPLILTNDILYGDFGSEVGGTGTISYSDIQGGYAGISNIDANPLFVNSPTDLHVQYGSPCLGAGTASGAPTTTLDGYTRPNPPSIGAYELTSATALSGLTLSPTTFYGGAPAYGKITLNGPAPPGGLAVSLTASSAFVTLPATITLPAGATSATFAYTSAAVTTDTTVTITASLGSSTQVATVTLLTKYTLDGTVTRSGAPLSGAAVALSGTGSFILTKNLATAAAIPDNNTTGISQTFTVPDIGTITDLKLGVNLTHPNVGDLIVTLTAPDGTSVVVHNRTGAGTQNLITSYPALTAPDNSLAVFNGKPTNGTWTLKVQDLAAGNVGTLNAWDITFTFNGSVTKTTTTDTSGNYQFSGLKVASYSVTPSLAGLTFAPTIRVVTVGPSQSSVNFAGYPVPTITGFTPTSGPVGTRVTVTGTGFTGATAVVLHGTSASFTVTSDTKITLTVPTGATTGHIDITTPGGTAVSPHNFTVIVPPHLTSLSPTSAYAGGSSLTLTVNGTGFVSGAVVKFGSIALTTTFVSSSQLTATITSTLRATVGTFPVTIVNPGSVTSNGLTFTLKPRLTGLTLSAARVSGGQTVTGTVTLNGPAPTGGVTIPLTSSSTTRATVPANVTVAAGATSATFPITTLAVTTTGSTTVMANGAGGTLTATLTVLAPVTPTADTFGQDGSTANTNFGTTNPLLVKTATSPGTNRDAYLQFSLSGLTTITSAKLRVTAYLSGAGSLTTNVYGTSSGWTESGLTWNNKPALGSTLGSFTATTTTSTTYTVDVTAYVQSQLSSGKVSFGLHNPSTSTIVTRLISREASSGAAQLVITGN